jgi:hypothetical protein
MTSRALSGDKVICPRQIFNAGPDLGNSDQEYARERCLLTSNTGKSGVDVACMRIVAIIMVNHLMGVTPDLSIPDNLLKSDQRGGPHKNPEQLIANELFVG